MLPLLEEGKLLDIPLLGISMLGFFLSGVDMIDADQMPMEEPGGWRRIKRKTTGVSVCADSRVCERNALERPDDMR